jgi:aldehyde:ferredoxin oxidoreductase
LFNLREGFTVADDTLPKRLMNEPIPGPDGTPQVVDLPRLLQEYYSVRGWNDIGDPTQEVLSRLGLVTGN